MKPDIAICSQQGPRPTQQDTGAILRLDMQMTGGSLDCIAAFIMDGNNERGDLVGKTACEVARLRFLEQVTAGLEDALSIKTLLARCLIEANDVAFDIQRDLPMEQRSGSTGTIALLLNRTLYYAYVGDSPILVLQNDRLCRLMRGHTLAEKLKKDGTIPRTQETSSLDSVLIRCLGIQETVRPSAGSVPIQPPAWIIAGSDGALRSSLDLQRIAGILKGMIRREEATAQAIAETLVRKSLDHGGDDNATIAVLRLPGRGPAIAPSDIEKQLGAPHIETPPPANNLPLFKETESDCPISQEG